MAKTSPSGFQIAYSRQLGEVVTAAVMDVIAREHVKIVRDLTGGMRGHSQLDPLPTSSVQVVAGEAGERARRAVLAYYREIGAFPE
jgi:hypothetical protein